MERYAEQLWITLFAKAPEITLFDYFQMQRPIQEDNRPAWKTAPDVSFDYDEMMQPIDDGSGNSAPPSSFAGAAGYSLRQVDEVLGSLGNPIGVKAYKPYHSVGEDHLHSYLGMIGIPVDIVAEFPVEEPICLLSEQSAADPDVVEKIKQQLVDGKNVVITSGFLRARQADVADIVELRYTDHKALVRRFREGRNPQTMTIDEPILIPQIKYLTNDSWEVVSALDKDNGWPLLHRAEYGNGSLYVLTIPENFEDLYVLPAGATSAIERVMTSGMNVLLDSPGKTSLFVYDNGTVVVESFNDEPVTVALMSREPAASATDILSGEVY